MQRRVPIVQLLSPKSGDGGSTSRKDSGTGDVAVPESPARNLAAMLRSTLRNPGPAGNSLRDAFTTAGRPIRQKWMAAANSVGTESAANDLELYMSS